jgi:hypothetical protein
MLPHQWLKVMMSFQVIVTFDIISKLLLSIHSMLENNKTDAYDTHHSATWQ